MDDSKNASKSAKKAAKAQAKAAKKLAKGAVGEPGSSVADTPTGSTTTKSGRTPAERAALAAERQVRLQSYRVWLAVATALIALIALLATIGIWKPRGTPELTPPTPAENTTESPPRPRTDEPTETE